MIKKLKKLLLRLSLAFCICFYSSVWGAEILLGMSSDFSGNVKYISHSLKAGIDAHFIEMNHQGGLNNNTLLLKAIDDRYDGIVAVENTRKLITEHNVLAMIGNVGTPTARLTVPLVNQEKTLLFGAYSGDAILRKSPPDRYVVNFRPSIEVEIEGLIEGLLVSGINPMEIAFFTQDRGFGSSGYKAAIRVLENRGFSFAKMLARGYHDANIDSVEEGLFTLLESDIEPKAIIMITGGRYAAKFIELAKQDFPDTLLLGLSAVGGSALIRLLGDNAEGVVITQVVPHYDADLPGVQAYRAALRKLDDSLSPNFISLEGYLLAKTFTAALGKIEGEINRESIIDSLETLSQYDLGIGKKISLSKTSHQASHHIWPSVIKNGQIRETSWQSITALLP